MKLRIKGNSIRLRLSKTEVQQVGDGSLVEEEVPFAGASLRYQILADATLRQISVSYQNNSIQVCLPLAEARQWAATDTIGIEEKLAVGDEKVLHLLIEKDFQCLHKRPDEDESNNFPNPAAQENQ